MCPLDHSRLLLRGHRRLSENFPLPARFELALRRHVFEVELVLMELSARTAAAILALAAPPLVRLALLFLKYAFEPGGVLAALPLAREALREQLALPAGAEALVVLWSYTRYVARVSPRVVIDEVERVLEPGRGRAVMKSFIEEVQEEAARSVIERQLIKKFGELPEAVRVRLAAASRAELELWAERLLEAAKLEDVFAG